MIAKLFETYTEAVTKSLHDTRHSRMI